MYMYTMYMYLHVGSWCSMHMCSTLKLSCMYMYMYIHVQLDTLPVVVTSYEICMRDQRHLMYRNWRFLVVDEGHRIKNLNCKLIRSGALDPNLAPCTNVNTLYMYTCTCTCIYMYSMYIVYLYSGM